MSPGRAKPVIPSRTHSASERRDALFPREKQELLELAAEEFRAARIVESERRQRVEYPVAARIAPVIRFDADDRDDNFRGNTKLVAGAVQRAAVFMPEDDAGVDACRIEKPRREFIPFGRRDN